MSYSAVVFFFFINKVTKVARMLAAKPAELGMEACSIMALLDGGMLGRQKSWLKVPIQAYTFSKSFLFFCMKIQKVAVLPGDKF